MCDPMSMAVATAGVSGASSLMGFMGQNDASKFNATEANLSYANNVNNLNTQSTQIDKQQSENTVTALINGIASRGRISAAAASGGAGASSTAAQANASDFAAGRTLSIQDLNSDNQRAQNQNQRDSANLQRETQIASVQPASPLSLIIGGANAALGGANEYAKLGGQFLGNG